MSRAQTPLDGNVVARGLLGGSCMARKRADRVESEKQIMHRTMIAMSDAGSRLFRNHVGVAFQGQPIRFSAPATIHVEPGDVLIKQARTVTAGLITGSADLIGWTQREIGEYDLGKLIAQFTAVEVKSADGDVEPEQQQFLEVVRDSGGCAIVARSAEQAVERLKQGGSIE